MSHWNDRTKMACEMKTSLSLGFVGYSFVEKMMPPPYLKASLETFVAVQWE